MEFYKKLIIKILERSIVGNDDPILKKLKNNIFIKSFLLKTIIICFFIV